MVESVQGQEITMRRRRAAGAAICQGCARGRLVPGARSWIGTRAGYELGLSGRRGIGVEKGDSWNGIEVPQHNNSV